MHSSPYTLNRFVRLYFTYLGLAIASALLIFVAYEGSVFAQLYAIPFIRKTITPISAVFMLVMCAAGILASSFSNMLARSPVAAYLYFAGLYFGLLVSCVVLTSGVSLEEQNAALRTVFDVVSLVAVLVVAFAQTSARMNWRHEFLNWIISLFKGERHR